MPSRKPRGLRVNKPELPTVYIPGNPVQYDGGNAYVVEAPFWSHDGYWEMEVQIDGHTAQLLWNPKKQFWVHKTF